MKIQITNFSVHQTAKVFSIMTFFACLLMVVPMILLPMIFSSNNDVNMGMPFGLMFFFMPFLQAIFAYIMVCVGCWIYNKLNGKIGGIEFEYKEKSV